MSIGQIRLVRLSRCFIGAAAEEFTLGKIELFVTPLALMLAIEFVGEYFHLFTAVVAFAEERFQVSE